MEILTLDRQWGPGTMLSLAAVEQMWICCGMCRNGLPSVSPHHPVSSLCSTAKTGGSSGLWRERRMISVADSPSFIYFQPSLHATKQFWPCSTLGCLSCLTTQGTWSHLPRKHTPRTSPQEVPPKSLSNIFSCSALLWFLKCYQFIFKLLLVTN